MFTRIELVVTAMLITFNSFIVQFSKLGNFGFVHLTTDIGCIDLTKLDNVVIVIHFFVA